MEFRTSGYTFLHDFALTPTHYVLMVCPVALDPTLFLLGVDSAAASVKWQEGKPSEVHLLGRPIVDAPAAPRTQNQHQQQHQKHAGKSQSNGAATHNSRQESVKPSAHQQQQLVKQQLKQGSSKTRHTPEHLVSQVETLSLAPVDCTGLLAGSLPLGSLLGWFSRSKAKPEASLPRMGHPAVSEMYAA